MTSPGAQFLVEVPTGVPGAMGYAALPVLNKAANSGGPGVTLGLAIPTHFLLKLRQIE